MTSRALVALLIALSSGPGMRAAHAQAPSAEAEPGARLSQIRELILYARYDEAEQALDALLAEPSLDALHRNAALEARATILVARNETVRVRAVLAELYGRDPEHQLIDREASPRVRAAFERARDEDPPRVPVTMESDTPAALPGRGAPVVSVRLTEGADVVHELRLNYRFTESGAYERSIMRLDADRLIARGRIPPLEGTEAYRVYWYVEAAAPSQARLAQLGSPSEPLTVDVPAATAAPSLAVTPADAEQPADDGGGDIAGEWWLWTIIGVVVLGGAALGIVFGLGLDRQVGPGTLGEGML